METICAKCRHDNPSGAKFCAVCGFPLLVSSGTSTTVIPVQNADEKQFAESERKPTPFSDDCSLTMVIGEYSVPVPIEKRVIFGRKNEESGPAIIDLAEYGSYQLGVSRNHAVLERVEDHLELIDLASVNGTFVNDERLRPHIGYGLQDGDTIKLGNLVATLRIQQPQ